MKLVNLEIDDYKKYNILIGTNKDENEKIIKMSSKNDLWFHLNNLSSPHIVLQNNGDIIPKRYLNYIGSLFREYKNGIPKKYQVIYTEIKNIKLTNKVGTVITKNTKILNF